MSEKKELNSLVKRWQRATGEIMPASIESLPIEKIRRAVELVESGATVVVPRGRPMAVAACGDSDSMQEWDGHNNG